MSYSSRELFEMWAHPLSPWSDWAKPTLFIEPPITISAAPAVPPSGWDASLGSDWAIVVDLPGMASVVAGLSLVGSGFRPVPLFNGCNGSSPAVEVAGVRDALYAAAAGEPFAGLPDDAPPAFLLDSRRKQSQRAMLPGVLDNRWICFPQDFPSGAMLKSRGINRVAVARMDDSMPEDDLLHVLRRWEEAGLCIHLWACGQPSRPRPIQTPRPRYFRAFFYAVMARMGLRQSFAGGFGSVIPQPSQG